MKKFIAWYKGLPKEVQMALVLLGLGTPTGLIFMIKRHFFPPPSKIGILEITFGFAIAIIVISLLCWGVSALFSVKQKKRSNRMVADLSRDDQAGPASMDVKASIKANNEKFFNAVRDMKKSLGVNVYDLPWYVVIGDSGCGKTRLINNGGLTFSAGKPEGYQLGTLNYNWWFTEDAVFIDMAGRLCNPQDDTDHREWQAFLDTIAKGRRGFPINGAFVCVSAEHLLSDSPEKHEADANTALERLRDLQGKLGVTFATYLIITKCDKILGFMQFFDRAERDITVKNQVFGWSKPGEFNDLYDPEAFGGDFGDLYHRLNDLRLRRLQDEANDADLGLAYSFPEEFRELLDPLQTYVRTLFPMIRNPRAMKNLIFRGIYFTSATQEGAVILKHLAQRLGAEAAEQFPSLDQLYPEKRPLFVKDVFFRKAFPEQGLVFRNENDVVRSQKLATLVKIGSAVLSIVLITALTWSYLNFKKLIRDPIDHAADAVRYTKGGKQADALTLGSALGKDVANLEESDWTRWILAFPLGSSSTPVESVKAIHAGSFEHSQIVPTLREADSALRRSETWTNKGEKSKDALLEYVKWWSCAGPETLGVSPNANSLDRFIAMLTGESAIQPARGPRPAEKDGNAGDKEVKPPGDFSVQATQYFTALPKLTSWRNPFRMLPEDDAHRFTTFKEALKLAHDKYWSRFATLSNDHANPRIRNWMAINEQCRATKEAYGKLLGLKDSEPKTREAWETLQKSFADEQKKLDAAFETLKWDPLDHEKGQYLRDAVVEIRKGWSEYKTQLHNQSGICGPIKHSEFKTLVDSLLKGGSDMEGLDNVLCQQLKSKNLLMSGQDCNPDSLENLPGNGLIHEVSDVWAYMVTPSGFDDGGLNPKITLTDDAQTLRKHLADMSRSLSAAGGALCIEDPDPLVCWNAAVAKLLDSAKSSTKDVAAIDLKYENDWRKPNFIELQKKHSEWLQQGQGTLLLTEIADRLGKTGDTGLADLFADHEKTAPSAFAMQTPTTQAAAPAAPAPEPPTRTRTRTAQDAQPTEPEPQPARGRNQEPDSTQPQAPRSRDASPVSATALKGSIPQWLTHRFFDTHLYDMSKLSQSVNSVPRSQFHSAQPGGSKKEECLDEIDESSKKYVTEYVSNWVRLYDARTLTDLKPAADARDWSSLAAALGGDSRLKVEVQDDVTAALGEILQAVPYALWYWDDGDKTWGPPSTGEENRFWNEIRDWRKNELARIPAGRRTFLSEARLGNDKLKNGKDLHPVRALAADVGREWARLAEAIVAARDIPRSFPDQNKMLPGITWDRIQALREPWSLHDEKLTGELVEFEKRAKTMLDAELTTALKSLQGSHTVCGTGSCPSAGTDLTAFKNFLLEVANAQAVLKSLEDGLSNMPLSPPRAAFYKQCAAWREFFGGTMDSKPFSLTDLPVTVSCEDPLSLENLKHYKVSPEKIDATPANVYSKMQLQVGLVKSGGSPLSEEETTWGATSSEWGTAKNGAWNWASDKKSMTFRLLEGKPDPARNGNIGEKLKEAQATLGTASSSLSLINFLLNDGTPDVTRKTWYILARIDLRTAFDDAATKEIVKKLPEDSQRMNIGFVFTLGRTLPARIDPL